MVVQNDGSEKSSWSQWFDMDLLKAKMGYFFYMGGLGSIYPIMALWMRSRGLTKPQTGVLLSARPFLSFIALPLTGLLADKLKIHKALLVGLCIATIAFRLIMIAESWLAWIAIFYMLAEVTGVPVSSLLDAGVMELLGPERRDQYGKQRVFGSLSFGLVALLMGLVVNAAGGNFNIYFFNHAAMAAVSAMIFLSLSVTSVKTPAPLWESVGIVFSSLHVFTFFLLITMIGAAQGVIGSFLFIMLDELNASKVTMGLATAVACAAEMPFLFFSKPLLRVLGERNMLYMACVGGIVRLIWYTLMQNPWLVLIAETMHGPFFGALWAASMSYVHTIAPPGLGATAQGLMAGLYGGLGQGIGAFVSGIIYQRWGYVVLFRATAVWLFFGLIIFLGTNIFFRPVNLEAIGHATAAISVIPSPTDSPVSLDDDLSSDIDYDPNRSKWSRVKDELELEILCESDDSVEATASNDILTHTSSHSSTSLSPN